MKNTNTFANGPKSTGTPMTEFPQAMRATADLGTTQARDTYEKMAAAGAEASVLIQNACSNATEGAVECNTKLIEFARANTNAAFDYANELLRVKSPQEFLTVATEHARRQYETLSAQAKELTALGQNAMRKLPEQLQAGAATAFRGPLA